MALLRPTPWTTQPQQACEIDWSNPICRGLAFAILPSSKGTSNLNIGVTKHGSIATNSIPDTRSRTTTSPFTIFAMGIFYSSTANNPSLFSSPASWNSLSDNAGCQLFRLHDTGDLAFGIWNNNNQVLTIAGVSPVGKQLSLVGSYDGTTARFYSDGNLAVSAASSGCRVVAGNVVMGSSAAGLVGGQVSAAWDRVLSDAEIKSLSTNPWQIFKPIPRRIFAPVATSSDHLIIGANSSQINTTSQGAIGQTHLATISNGAQVNTASDAAINQTHLVTASASNQSNVASDAAISQSAITLVTVADSTQANTASQSAINQTHLVSVAASNQANVSSDAAIQQAHLVSVSTSNQANVASPASITQALDKFVTAADSTQSNAASAGSIQQTHLIQCAGVAIDNVASASSVVQEHLLTAANSAQGNSCSSASVGSFTPLTDSEKIDLILDILSNKQTLDPVSGLYTLYADDGVTVLKTALAWEDVARTIPYRGMSLQVLDPME